MKSAKSAMGTLMRNTQRHPEMKRIWFAPAKSPPMSGPITEEMPNTPRK